CCAEAVAEEDDVLGFGRALVAELVDDLRDVVALPVAGGGVGTATLSVGAKVGDKEVVAEGMKQRSPGDRADFGVAVAVDEDGGAVAVGIGNPPGGDVQRRSGALVVNG